MSEQFVDNSNLSYTSRDYDSIFRELINTIPLLTKDWTAREESDPGIVLVKLMAMVGDMLSYNIDKQALELFPESVTQRKNAYQIYNLQGYKMHWYKSARCSATITVNSQISVDNYVIPRYSRFVTATDDKNSGIYYTNIKDINVSSGDTNKNIELVQGIAKTPPLIVSSSEINADTTNGQWWMNYGSNLSSSDISEDNKYYLNDTNVDEDTIVLCDKSGEWVLVEDIDLVTDINSASFGNRYFDFRIDEYDRPYIRLCSSWRKNNENEEFFKLFYLISKGSEGQISANTLTAIDSRNIVNIINSNSTIGYDPETPAEAWINSRKWVNTGNTLITCDDFTKATKRVAGVANAVALDWMNDIQDPIESNMQNYEVRIYIIPDEEYIQKQETDRDTTIRIIYENIERYLRSRKILHLLFRTYWDGNYDPSLTEINSTIIDGENVIKHYKWSVQGIVYYRTPLSKNDSDEIITLINNTLRTRFSNKKININQAIRYIDVVNEILACDSRILYVDLNPIAYWKIEDDTIVPVEEKDVTGKVIIEIPPNPIIDEDDPEYDPEYNPCLYEIDLTTYDSGAYEDTLPIKPSTVSIKIETGNFTIYDDGNGKLISGWVEGENSIIANDNGSIDYGRYDSANKGKIKFELRYAVNSPIILSYKTNQIAIAEYENLDPEKFYASADSLKRKV